MPAAILIERLDSGKEARIRPDKRRVNIAISAFRTSILEDWKLLKFSAKINQACSKNLTIRGRLSPAWESGCVSFGQAEIAPFDARKLLLHLAIPVQSLPED